MKQIKKHLSIALVSVVILSFFPLNVYAHAGKTDAAGGHYELSTGEYHYHHGYEPHQHYDMNGDGVIDCPYDFDDKTSRNVGGTSSSSNSNSSYITQRTAYQSSTTSVPKADTKDTEREQNHSSNFLGMVIFGLFIYIGYLFHKIVRITNDYDKTLEEYTVKLSESNSAADTWKKKYESQFAASQSLDETLSNLESARKEESKIRLHIKEQYQELEKLQKRRCILERAPMDVMIAENGMPVYWKYDPAKPYGDYTVYSNERSNIYHIDKYCAGYSANKTHIFKVIDTKRPCQKCARGYFHFTTVPEWFTQTEE